MEGAGNQFQIGGSISENTSIYVWRQADHQIFEALKNSELCYVLNSRQMGKSSLLLNAKNRLQKDGYVCCFIDLSRIGSVEVSPEQWYAGICSELWRGFKLGDTADMLDWWHSLGDLPPAQKLLKLISQHLIEHYPSRELIIFLMRLILYSACPSQRMTFFP